MSEVPTFQARLCSPEDAVELASAIALAEAVDSTQTAPQPTEEIAVVTVPENTFSSASHADPTNGVTGSGGSPVKHNESQTSVDVNSAVILNEQDRTCYEGLSEEPSFVEGEVYPVERIINRRVTAIGVEYRIKWFGYPSSLNTWEPECNLDCPDEVAEFLELENPKDLNFSNDESDSECYGPVIFETESINKKIKLSKDIDKNMDETIDRKTGELKMAVVKCINEKENFDKFVDVNMAQPEAQLTKCENENEKICNVKDENMNKPETPLATRVNEKENFSEVVDVNMSQPEDVDIEKHEDIKMVKLENVKMEVTEDVNMDETGDIIIDEEDIKKIFKVENETMMMVDTVDNNDNSIIVINKEDECINGSFEVNIDHSLQLNSPRLNKKILRQFKKYLYDVKRLENKEPNKILGLTNEVGEIVFLINWKNSNCAELVPSKIASVRWPHLVIGYYEKLITFIPPPK